jgi:SAM-dependent methyltransferase
MHASRALPTKLATKYFPLLALLLLAAAGPPANAEDAKLDVPYVPTPQVVVDKMLELADVKSGDYVIDLGSGDGRIPITAAKRFGTKGLGVDLNPIRVQEATANAANAGVQDKVEFRRQNLFETDFSKATVLTMYLLPDVNKRLRPRILRELAPGTRVVSHSFDMGDWMPDEKVTVEGRTIYMWVVPENGQFKSSKAG